MNTFSKQKVDGDFLDIAFEGIEGFVCTDRSENSENMPALFDYTSEHTRTGVEVNDDELDENDDTLNPDKESNKESIISIKADSDSQDPDTTCAQPLFLVGEVLDHIHKLSCYNRNDDIPTNPTTKQSLTVIQEEEEEEEEVEVEFSDTSDNQEIEKDCLDRFFEHVERVTCAKPRASEITEGFDLDKLVPPNLGVNNLLSLSDSVEHNERFSHPLSIISEEGSELESKDSSRRSDRSSFHIRTANSKELEISERHSYDPPCSSSGSVQDENNDKEGYELKSSSSIKSDPPGLKIIAVKKTIQEKTESIFLPGESRIEIEDNKDSETMDSSIASQEEEPQASCKEAGSVDDDRTSHQDIENNEEETLEEVKDSIPEKETRESESAEIKEEETRENLEECIIAENHEEPIPQDETVESISTECSELSTDDQKIKPGDTSTYFSISEVQARIFALEAKINGAQTRADDTREIVEKSKMDDDPTREEPICGRIDPIPSDEEASDRMERTTEKMSLELEV